MDIYLRIKKQNCIVEIHVGTIIVVQKIVLTTYMYMYTVLKFTLR